MAKIRYALLFMLMVILPALPSSGQSASGASGTLEINKKENRSWLQQKFDERLNKGERNSRRPPDYGWKLKPGIAFRWARKGIDMSIGPRLGVAKKTSKYGRVSINASYLPLNFSDLKSGSKLGYTRVDLGYRHFLNPKMFVGVGASLHNFSPSQQFRDEIAARKGNVSEKSINTQAISFGHQIFKIAWSYRGKKRVWPFFAEVTYQFADDYEYGTDLGDAGSEYRIKSGASFRIRPLVKQF